MVSAKDEMLMKCMKVWMTRFNTEDLKFLEDTFWMVSFNFSVDTISSTEVTTVNGETTNRLTAFGTVEFYGSVIEKNTSAIFTVASGGVYVRNMTATNSTVTSDKRLKNNISPITQKYINSIGEVDLIEYNYVPEIDTEEKLNFGVVAQDVIASLEKNNCTDKMGIVLTHKEKFDDYSTDYYGVNYNQFLLLRIAYDEQKISELTDRIKALETAISK